MILAVFGSEQVAAFGVKCLAVAGGFLAGYVLGGFAAWGLDRWLFAKKSPDVLKKAISVLAGIALAALVAFLVFGEGGGLGFGGRSGGAGSSNSNDGQKTESPAEQKQPVKIDTPKTPEPHADDPKVRITFLGGDAVQGDRFYKIEDDPVPKSLPEVKAELLRRKESAKGTLTLIVLFPTDPRFSIDPNSINVTQVTSWAEGQGIGIFRPGKR
jgi:hypothetical protein